MPKPEPEELTEEQVDELHNAVLDKIKETLRVFKTATYDLMDRYDVIGSHSIKIKGLERSQHVIGAIATIVTVLSSLDLPGLVLAHEKMLLVDQMCKKWNEEAEIAAKTANDQLTNQPPA